MAKPFYPPPIEPISNSAPWRQWFSQVFEKIVENADAADGSFLHKATATTRNSTTTLTADPDLATTLDASSFYTIRGHVLFEAHATPDIAYTFTEPDGTYQMVLYKADEIASTVGVEAIFETFAGNSVAMNGIGTTHWVSFLGGIQTGGTGGTFSFDWTQNTSSAEDTTVMAGSWMFLKKLNA